jgi:hypothetical protein
MVGLSAVFMALTFVVFALYGDFATTMSAQSTSPQSDCVAAAYVWGVIC